MKDFRAFCEHYLGGGDFGTCCSVQNGLRYGYDYACEHFKEDYLRKQAFRTGIILYKEALKNNKSQTNADRIRAMTDEELAEFLNTVNTEFCSSVMGKSPCRAENCPCWLEWLKEEATDVN